MSSRAKNLVIVRAVTDQGMSIAQTNQIHQQWALPGAVGVAEWPLTTNVQSFLSAAGQNQAKDPTVAVTATPVAGQVKATDASDWVLACVLLDIRAFITRLTHLLDLQEEVELEDNLRFLKRREESGQG